MSQLTEQKDVSLPTSRIIGALGAMVLALMVLLVVTAVMPDALKYFFGFTTAQATGAAGAILAGMDVATAVSIFGGAIAIGGIALAVLRRAIGKKALVQ